MATTLGEILQARGDADYANGGEGGAVNPELYNSAAANEYLQHAADLTYNAHRYLAEQHDRNMQEELKGLNEVDFKNLLPQDQAALMPEYSGVTQDIANNFGVIRNPLSNPQQYAALKNGESGFRQKLAQAQSDAAFINKQNEFVQTHPEFNTPDYKQKVAQFLATPVGQRQPFVVTPPLTYNPATAYKTIAELAKKKYAAAKTNGKYITQEEGEKIDPTQYMQLAQQLPGTDQYGNSLETARQNAFNNLPANIKSQYKDYNDFVNKEAALYKPQDQVNKSEIKPDEYGVLSKEQAFQRQQQLNSQAYQTAAADKAFQDQLILAGMKKGAVNPEQVAENNLRTVALIEKSGNIPQSLGQELFADNSQFDKKVRDPNNPDDDKLVSTVKTPTETFVNSGIDQNGNLHVYLKNNITGKMLQNAKVISHQDLLNALNNAYGQDNAIKIQGAMSKFSKDNFKKEIPDATDLLTHFGLGTDVVPTTRAVPAAGSKYNAPLPSKVTWQVKSASPANNQPAEIKTQADYDTLPKGAQYIDPTDGKTYIKK